ncbi:MAG: GGDEF domain-containing protein [Kutzneria sp.]|nr:GGDEF domain-containing protein [Kutzneria sp.]
MVETCVAALIVAAFVMVPVHPGDLVVFGVLLALGIAQAEMSRRGERLRRQLSETPHINMTAVWLVPGAILLPPGLAAVLGVLLYLHLGLRSWYRLHSVAPCRMMASAAVVVLSCFASSGALMVFGVHANALIGEGATPERTALFVASVLAFELVNATVTAVALYLAAIETPTARMLFGSWEDNALEFATVCLGGLTAAVLIYQPILVIFTFIPLLVLHRSVLVKQLEVAATTDHKTGLLNAVAWHNLARVELSRARRSKTSFGILMVDLDHFKRVNDTYGHLAGDAVLKAVADAVKGEVRDYDSAGRFGGEEFAVLLPGISEADVVATAERIRHRVTTLAVDVPLEDGRGVVDSLSASIGVAVYPYGGPDVEGLLLTADSALYKAKDTGRNKVVSVAA